MLKDGWKACQNDEIKTALQAELTKGGTFKSGKKAKTVDRLGEM